jgi:hypothetical protein
MPPYFHKRFRRLALYISDESLSTLPFRQMLTSPLTTLYSNYLKGPSFNGIYSINIYLTSLETEQGQIKKEVRGFLDYYVLFDFNAFAQLATDLERKYYLLACIQQATNQVTKQEGWDIVRFEQAHQACINAVVLVTIR